MTLDELVPILQNQWINEGLNRPFFCPPEARVITGRIVDDAHLHHLVTEYGLELVLEQLPTKSTVVDYQVLDEKKFAWFILKWA